MEVTVGRSYSMWNFQEWFIKGVEFIREINKRATYFRCPVFSALRFSWGVTHFYGITRAMTFDFLRIFKTNPETSMEYLKKHFLNHLACFFLEQTTDRQIYFWVLRYPTYCNSVELLPESPQNKIYYRLHPKYTSFSCFPGRWNMKSSHFQKKIQ